MASRLMSSEETFRSELRAALGECEAGDAAANAEGARRGEAGHPSLQMVGDVGGDYDGIIL